MAKGFAVVTGSSTVVAKILEDGTVTFGDEVPVSASISGTLVLELEGSEADARFLRSDAVGSASWANISGSEVLFVPTGDITSSNVQDAIVEIRADIAAAAGSGSFSVSDGGNTEAILTDGTQTITWTGTANEITTSYAPGTNTFTLGLTDDVVIPNNLTVTNDLTVQGTSSFLNVENLFVEDPLITLASGNVAQTLDQGLVMTRSGSNQAMLWDESADEFAFVETTEDGTTAGNVTIDAYANLHVGELTASNANFTGDVDIDSTLNVDGASTLGEVTASAGVLITGGGLEVTGAVNLPDASIDNVELVNSQIRFDLGFGLTSSLGDPFDTALGGTASFALNTGSGGVALADTEITISGTANEVDVNGGLFATVNLGSGGTFTIGLPDDVEIAGNLIVTGNVQVSGSTYLGTDGADETIVNSKLRLPIFTTASVPSEYVTSPEDYAGHFFFLSGSGSGSGDFQTPDKWYFNEGGIWYKSFFKST